MHELHCSSPPLFCSLWLSTPTDFLLFLQMLSVSLFLSSSVRSFSSQICFFLSASLLLCLSWLLSLFHFTSLLASPPPFSVAVFASVAMHLYTFTYGIFILPYIVQSVHVAIFKVTDLFKSMTESQDVWITQWSILYREPLKSHLLNSVLPWKMHCSTGRHELILCILFFFFVFFNL